MSKINKQILDEIVKLIPSEKYIDLVRYINYKEAIAQLTGYVYSQSYNLSISPLLDSMGLEEYEWQEIKNEYVFIENYIEEIDKYFDDLSINKN